mgnify:CR=1 FL=1|jgi:uncharacterized protein YuzE
MALDVTYDDEADVLYVSIDAPRPAFTENLGEGLLLRRDPVSDESVGVTIMRFLHHFAELGSVSPLRQRGVPDEVLMLLEKLQKHPDDVRRMVEAEAY